MDPINVWPFEFSLFIEAPPLRVNLNINKEMNISNTKV